MPDKESKWLVAKERKGEGINEENSIPGKKTAYSKTQWDREIK